LQLISQLSQILEDAITNKKEVWILSQDMSKAFDSIHIPTLCKALKRIHIPDKAINLISFLLSHRTNRVITSLGLTAPYSVEDGIDQGETFSPLLWKIYYDPLISRIYKEHLGFSSEIPSINPKKINTSVMAYMDDSLWIAPNKISLTNILNTASSFYKFANIKVNPSKSILVTNSTDSDNSILFNGEQLIAINNGKPFKYLGAWFSTNKRPTLVQKEIMAEVTINLKKLHFANITEKQAIYIINSVIIS
jgi:hypothetical protein